MVAKYSQDGRVMAVTTPLGKDVLLLERVQGTEGLSELFEFHLDLLAHPDRPVPFEAVVGQKLTVKFQGNKTQTPRYVNGLVSRFGQVGTVRGVNGAATFVRYTATVVPDLWRLTKVHRSRIFQQVNVPDILKVVLAGLTVDWRLSGQYLPRDYCSQYKETDYQFAARLMEEEGIFFYFQHAAAGHTLIVGDSPAAHDPIAGPTALIFDDSVGGGHHLPENRVGVWAKSQELGTGKVTLWDHSFELPPQNLAGEAKVAPAVKVGGVTHKLAVGGNDRFELYDYPGRYAQRRDGVDPSGGDRPADVAKVFEDHDRTAGLRMQQEAAGAVVVEARATVRPLCAGHTFSLTRHGDGDGDYLVRRAEITADVSDEYHGREHGGGAEYACAFTAMPAALPFRPPFTGERGRIHGVQAGTVVGPAGEEIFTDKYGRVKVQFRWDRDGTFDPNSSCWVRVATAWAGKQWGAIHLPRIGQEVLIAFEEGDPDRPIIVGSVYNADQMPPYKLPANRTQSGVKTRSSLKGTPENFNELRFEDKKGEEQIYFHAEKNFDQVVENNQTLKVGFREGGQAPEKGDQTTEIHNNQALTVGKPHPSAGNPADGSRTEKVWNSQTVTVGYGEGQAADGSQTTTVWKDRTATVKTGNDSLAIKQGNRAAVLDMGNDKLSLKMGNHSTKLDLGSYTIEAMQSITLKVGMNKIVIDQTGVSINGVMVTVKGTATTEVSAPMTTVKGTGMMTVSGGIIMVG